MYGTRTPTPRRAWALAGALVGAGTARTDPDDGTGAPRMLISSCPQRMVMRFELARKHSAGAHRCGLRWPRTTMCPLPSTKADSVTQVSCGDTAALAGVAGQDGRGDPVTLLGSRTAVWAGIEHPHKCAVPINRTRPDSSRNNRAHMVSSPFTAVERRPTEPIRPSRR